MQYPLAAESLIRFRYHILWEYGLPAEVTIKLPEKVDAEKVKRRIKEILGIIVSDEFDKFIDYVEEYGLLRLEEESLREFLEDEPNDYSLKDIKR